MRRWAARTSPARWCSPRCRQSLRRWRWAALECSWVRAALHPLPSLMMHSPLGTRRERRAQRLGGRAGAGGPVLRLLARAHQRGAGCCARSVPALRADWARGPRTEPQQDLLCGNAARAQRRAAATARRRAARASQRILSQPGPRRSMPACTRAALTARAADDAMNLGGVKVGCLELERICGGVADGREVVCVAVEVRGGATCARLAWSALSAHDGSPRRADLASWSWRCSPTAARRSPRRAASTSIALHCSAH